MSLDPTETQTTTPDSMPALVPPSEDRSVPDPSPPPSEKRLNLWGGALVLLLLLGGFGWLIYSRFIAPLLGGGPPAFGPMAVTVLTPTATNVSNSSEYVAELQSRQSIMVQPQVTGRITQIYVRSGDRVAVGTPLLQLDAAEQQAQVTGTAAAIQSASADLTAARADAESARRALDALKADRLSRKSDLAFNEEEYKRYQDLTKQGAASQQLLAEKLNDLRQARASLAQMDAQIKAQEAAISRAQANIIRAQQQRDQATATANQSQVQLRYYSVTAPIDGVIGEVPAKVGDQVSPTTPLLNVTQNRQLEVQIAIPQEKSADLRLGLPVQLLNDAGKVLQSGAISYIAPNVDPQTQSIQAKAVFENSEGQLRTNQLVRTRVVWQNRTGLLVPTTAISRLAGRSFIFVAQPYGRSDCATQGKGKAATEGAPAGTPPPPEPNQLVAAQKPVTLGQIVGNNQEILSGLTRSDRVIVSGLQQLQGCMPIQVASAKPTP